MWKHSVVGDTGSQNQLFQDEQKPGQFRMRTFDDKDLDSSAYAILVSCHCTHTGELALSSFLQMLFVIKQFMNDMLA